MKPGKGRFSGGVGDDYGKATNQVAFYRTPWWLKDQIPCKTLKRLHADLKLLKTIPHLLEANRITR